MDTKEQIINEYLVGSQGYRVLEAKHGISRCTINRWVLAHQRERESIRLCEMKKKKPGEVLSSEVIELKKQLEQERMHTKLLTAIIEIAEQELKIPIRKKYGTKLLKK